MPSGTIDFITDPPYAYGDEISFEATYEGSLRRNERVYITVIAVQDSQVVYQRSGGLDFTFKLAQQVGLAAVGLFWDKTRPARGSATLTYKLDRKREDVIDFLDAVEFAIGPEPTG